METWLVVDLRRNQCAAGLLSIGAGRPRWTSEQMYISVSPDAKDSRVETDLAFFRAPESKYWSSAISEVLSHLDERHEKIPALFDVPADVLADLVPVTLGPLLAKSLKNYPSPLLFVIDRADVRPSLERFLNRIRRNGKVQVVPRAVRLDGFALLDPSQTLVPAEGATYLCQINKTRGEREVRRYVWSKHGFAVSKQGDSVPANVPMWESDTEMERLGTALFALIWQARVIDAMHKDIEALGQVCHDKEQLLDRMRAIFRKLTDAAALPAGMGV